MNTRSRRHHIHFSSIGIKKYLQVARTLRFKQAVFCPSAFEFREFFYQRKSQHSRVCCPSAYFSLKITQAKISSSSPSHFQPHLPWRRSHPVDHTNNSEQEWPCHPQKRCKKWPYGLLCVVGCMSKALLSTVIWTRL